MSDLYSLLLLSISACPLPENGQELITQIEANISLPDGRELDEYARSYTVTDDCKIIAHYVVPWRNPDELVQVAQRSLADPPPIACRMGMENYLAALEAWKLGEGQTQWVADPLHLPEYGDAGCNMVALEFDLETKQANKVVCSGTLEMTTPEPTIVDLPPTRVIPLESN